MTPRAVVTGVGVISSIGNNLVEFCQSLHAGKCGASPIESAQTKGLRFTSAAQVRNFDCTDHFPAKDADMLDRFAQLALVAGREAVCRSGIEWTPQLQENTAVVTGSCLGGQTTSDQAFVGLYKKGQPRVHPMSIPKTMANAGASAISLEFGLHGPAFTLATACSSSAHAIGLAASMVRFGMCDVAIAGGSEATFSPGILRAWEGMRVVSSTLCRPFSLDRNGMLLGEGAAMLVIENMDHARARGAEPIAEIAGFGMSSDAHHVTQPAAEGAARAMTRAIGDAGIVPSQVGYINAHGTGTVVNDATETRAIHQTFGSWAPRLAVSSTKAMHGHTLGAAGAMEAIATIIALREGFLPPTIHFSESDPDCDLDYVPNVARKAETEYALSNSFAFGGLNAALVIRRLA